MRIKMWCLVNKNKNRVIHVWSGDGYVVGFATKKDLLNAIEVDGQFHIEHDERVKKVEIEVTS